MNSINNLNLFVESILESDIANKRRNQHLANIILKESKKEIYAVQITFQINLLSEYVRYKKFSKTKNLYTFHPENVNIPVKSHYHIVIVKGKNEIYAVNTDGTAHHKTNRGFAVPPKEANELRNMGVNLGSNNILESINNFDSSQYYDVLFWVVQ